MISSKAVEVELGRQSLICDPRVGDHQIERAQVPFDLGHHFFHLLAVGDVGFVRAQ